MPTTAATSTSTSTSSTDDSPTINDNDGATSGHTTSNNDDQPCEQQRKSIDNPQQRDESKKLDLSPNDSKHQDQPLRHSPDASVIETTNDAPASKSFSPSTTSSSSSSSMSKEPPSAMQTTKESTADVKNNQSPSSQNQLTTNNTTSNAEQKRPMNAFLLFCKRQRSLVREKHPNLENRGITKILGDWWTNLDKEQKSKYTDLARQHKEAFMKANPDFKWCKTPNVSNLNNNNSNHTAGANDTGTNNQSNEQKHQQNHRASQHLHSNQSRHQPQNNIVYHHNLQQDHHMASATDVELLTLQSVNNNTNLLHRHSANSIDMSVTNRQQLGAPKPPKKRFLERTDSIYTTKDNNSSSSRHDTSLNGADIVPCMTLDQDTLDRVIDKAFSEDSNSCKSSIVNNSCKYSNRNPTNLTMSLSNNSSNPISFSLTTTAAATTTSTSSSSSSFPMSVDEPVDFSMNRTINPTKQEIINNLVEYMLSDPSDHTTGSFSKLNNKDSGFKSYAGPPVKKDKPDAS